MAEYNIKDFSEIDFVNIDPSEDTFIFPDGTKYRFSDHMCDFCWSGGTVLESETEKDKYVCVICGNSLAWYEFENDFLQPTGDKMKFLLPEDWSGEEAAEWFQAYKERRLAQEKVRENILKFGKE